MFKVYYTCQVKAGDTFGHESAAGPFSNRATAEQFAIQLASRMALLRVSIEEIKPVKE